MYKFEWNKKKTETNFKKHGVTFEEALTVFSDLNAFCFDDPNHFLIEERYILLGFSDKANLLIVCHCIRGDDLNTIRIISSRKATRKEYKDYYELCSMVRRI